MEDGGANAGAEGEHDDGAGAVLAGTEAHFGNAGGVGIVHDGGFGIEVGGEERGGVHIDPRFVHIRGGVDDSFFHNRGEGDACGSGVIEMGGDLLDDIGDGVGEGGLRRGDAEALGEEFAGFCVDGCAFDSRAADVDAEDVHGWAVNLVRGRAGRQGARAKAALDWRRRRG